MVDIATGLDDAGVPLIQVTHGDGLGGSSLNYGRGLFTDEQYLRAVAPKMKNATISVLHVPGIGTLDELRMAADCGAGCVHVATHCTEADVSEQHSSEEHTSEIQSLMRTSYAVFCLKKKKHNKNK